MYTMMKINLLMIYWNGMVLMGGISFQIIRITHVRVQHVIPIRFKHWETIKEIPPNKSGHPISDHDILTKESALAITGIK